METNTFIPRDFGYEDRQKLLEELMIPKFDILEALRSAVYKAEKAIDKAIY